MIGGFHDLGQIPVRIQFALNGDQAEHDCAASGTLGCVGKQKFLPVNDKGFDASFGMVVGYLQTAILQVVCKVRPLLF